MGQELSIHEEFIKGIQKSLKTTGVTIKRKDLVSFFNYVQEICPWFPQEGIINEMRWVWVRDAIQDHYRICGPKKVPVIAPMFWTLINYVLSVMVLHPDVEAAVKACEEYLKAESKRGSVKGSKKGFPSWSLPEDEREEVLKTKSGAPQKKAKQVFGFPSSVTLKPPLEGRVRLPMFEKETFETLKEELKDAVTQFGPEDPFTRYCLEGLGDMWLTPREWHQVARDVLKVADYTLWKTEFYENCKEAAQHNVEIDGPSALWSLEKMVGDSPYDINVSQLDYPLGLYSQVQLAAMKAWKVLPPKHVIATSITKVIQGPEEPYKDFIDRLLMTAERLCRSEQEDNPLLLHLAFENANPVCQEVLGPHRQRKTLVDYIRLCLGIGPSDYRAQALLKQAELMTSKKCFNCKQEGHFARNCSVPKQRERAGPPGLCPICHQGKHWASSCRSKTRSRQPSASFTW